MAKAATDTGMQVNMLEAKSQLSRLVKAALAGEDVVIASNGRAQVKLVPITTESGLNSPGSLKATLQAESSQELNAAFSDAVDAQVRDLFAS